jgi:TonB family protein
VRWRRYEDPVFPLPLRATAVQDGSAMVAFTFDATGRITDRLVLAASHPAFSTSIYDAMLNWEIEPTELAHSSRRETIRFEFELHNSIRPMTQRDAFKSVFTRYGDQAATALRTWREEEIRPELKPVATAMPVFPAALSAQNARGSATVSFVVDTEGGVRVPGVTDATEPEFGEAALAAIRQWRFAPPLQNGTPAQVLVERTFRFGRSAAGK